MRNKFRYFNSSPEEIRLTVMIYVRYALSLRQVEDLFHKRGNGFVWLRIRVGVSRDFNVSVITESREGETIGDKDE